MPLFETSLSSPPPRDQLLCCISIWCPLCYGLSEHNSVCITECPMHLSTYLCFTYGMRSARVISNNFMMGTVIGSRWLPKAHCALCSIHRPSIDNLDNIVFSSVLADIRNMRWLFPLAFIHCAWAGLGVMWHHLICSRLNVVKEPTDAANIYVLYRLT